MGGITCPNCNSPNKPNFKFCGTCGHPLEAAPAPAPVAGPGPARGKLILIRPDGSEGETIPLSDGMSIGRATGGIFASDSYLSPTHASFQLSPAGLTVIDEGSLNGVFLRIRQNVPMPLENGSIIRVGQEILRFETFPAPSFSPDGVESMGSPSQGLVGRLCLVTGRQTTGNCYPIPAAGLHLGRERGDLLFPDDGYVSGLHARIHLDGDRVVLTDIGSSNGTFIRIKGRAPVENGAMLLVGQQLFRAEY